MPRPNRSHEIDRALLAAVEGHPKALVSEVAHLLGLSRVAVSNRARVLVEQGFLTRTGSTRPVYGVGANRRRTFNYQREGLAEDRVWSRDVAPLLAGVARNVVDIAHHAITEMVNNAIDHSEGEQIDVWVERDGKRIVLGVMDDGVGIFHKIARALDLDDERLALLELSKGKLTTDPRRHSGEGIFFTSRMLDSFQILSGELVFDHDEDGDADMLFDVEESSRQQGTAVWMEIGVDSPRSDADVFREFSSGPDDFAFAKTIVPVRLARIGDENLVSRSQAKRLLRRVEKFRIVVLDFEGVQRVGQAFTDEIFRVFANEHPEVELLATHASVEVQQMVRRAEVLRDEDANQQPLF